jgi:UDP-glucose 4-epimerase
VLRYFNVAGAHPEVAFYFQGTEGRRLTARVLVAVSKGEPVSIYCATFPTEDGTCVRDYVHVMDVVDITIKALELPDELRYEVYNAASGVGTSTLQILSKAESVVGKGAHFFLRQSRACEVSIARGSILKAQRALNWRPQNSDLKGILTSVHLRMPE